MPPTERVFIIHSELAFLSGLVYFIETIIVIQLPEHAGFTRAAKTNDTAVFYFSGS